MPDKSNPRRSTDGHSSWEELAFDSFPDYGYKTCVMEVPGGSLYRVTYDSQGKFAVTTTFVPDAPIIR